MGLKIWRWNLKLRVMFIYLLHDYALGEAYLIDTVLPLNSIIGTPPHGLFFNYGEFAIITFKFFFRDENKFVIQTKYRKLQPKTNKNIIELCQSHLSRNC